MHIPDGYLGPETYIPLMGAFVAAAAVAVFKVKKEVSAKNIPYLGMAAAFSFIIMMFNLPIPGGTTGHAVGAAMIAILLGPWATVMAVSVALVIQALIFGDGGITAIGANCFNMAVFMPFVAYWIFKLVRMKSEKSGRVFFAAFMAGYISLVLTAVLTAVEFGIQPLIATTADGKALYCPYDLSVAIPAMAIEHLVLFGVAEGLVTAFIVRYFFNHDRENIYAMQKGGRHE
ncbi:MAG TPA: cobalamin biosynthesis protein CbiM [Bacteroidales bacterium]|nr:cobalamin biosynthesis protein CbiM [Bacteroidales bacterium]HCB63600.1 cobalamin biosynthesis protein CbiM [Bacteroidales bacterium]HCY24349.1 cobalamin biosynthesis protein CbiM [Bacteroidales bacterium]